MKLNQECKAYQEFIQSKNVENDPEVTQLRKQEHEASLSLQEAKAKVEKRISAPLGAIGGLRPCFVAVCVCVCTGLGWHLAHSADQRTRLSSCVKSKGAPQSTQARREIATAGRIGSPPSQRALASG